MVNQFSQTKRIKPNIAKQRFAPACTLTALFKLRNIHRYIPAYITIVFLF